MPHPGSSTCNTISAFGLITPGSSPGVPAMNIISGRVSRTLSIAAAVPGTAWHHMIALTDGSEAIATAFEITVSVSVEKLSG